MSKWILSIALAFALASCAGGVGIGQTDGNQAVQPPVADQVALAQALSEVEAWQPPAEADPRLAELLRAELGRALAALGRGRQAAATTFDPGSRAVLEFDDPSRRLVWGYYSTGDYDQNGEVNASDLTPIAINFGKSGVFDPNGPEALVDGDSNGEINASDITPIAINFGATVTGYRIYHSMNEGDYPADEAAENGAGTQLLTTVLLPPGSPPETRIQFSYDLAVQDFGYYWVRPSDGTEVGSPSNLLQVPSQFNDNPVAVLTAIPQNGDVPLLVSFNASGSSDPDGEIVKYEFDWDGPLNGEVWFDAGTDPLQSHAYTTVGIYTAVLRVTDDDGGRDTAEITISVTPEGNDPPVADLQSNKSGGEIPLQVIFDASASFDPDGGIDRFEWDFNGDGKIDEDSGANPVLNYTYFEPGEFNATVKVYDNGGLSNTASVPVSVTGNPQDWRMFRRDAQHSGRSGYTAPGAVGPFWSHLTGGAVTSSPVIGLDGTIYVGSEDGYLYALRTNNTRKWRFNANEPILSTPALDRQGNVFFGCDAGEFISIDSDGIVRWRVQTDGDIQSSPLVTPDEMVFFGSADGDLYCYSTSGSEIWVFQTTEQIRSSPALHPNGNIIFGHSTGRIYAVNQDGGEEWFYETGGYVASSPAIAQDGTIYIGSDDNYVYSLHPDGTLNWRYQTGANVFSSPAIDSDGTVYVGGTDGFLYSLSPAGELNWQFPTNGQLWSSPLIDSTGRVFIGCTDNKLYAVNPDNTLDWTYQTGNIIHSSPALAVDGTLYIGSEDGFLHSITAP